MYKFATPSMEPTQSVSTIFADPNADGENANNDTCVMQGEVIENDVRDSEVESSAGNVRFENSNDDSNDFLKNIVFDEDAPVNNEETTRPLKITETRYSDSKRYCISREDWRKVEETPGRYNLENLRYVIRKVCVDIFSGCVITFVTHRKNKNTTFNGYNVGEPVLVYYGKCKHESCRQFRFDISYQNDNSMMITVSPSGQIHHVGKLASQLRGLERTEARQELKWKKALQYRSEVILKANEKSILSGNLLDIRSLEVFRQARAEAAKMCDKHRDDSVDLLMRLREDRDGSGNQFIQKVGEPLHVHLFSKAQIKVLKSHFQRKGMCVLHIDSTGSVVRPLVGDFRTVYYYSGCVNFSGKVMPVFDFISSKHDAATIGSFFSHFLHFQNKHFGKRLVVTHIVTDFSQALLQAVMLSWNKMTLFTYLVRMFYFTTGRKNTVNTMVTVHLCCSHFMNMASGDLTRLGVSLLTKKFYLFTIAALINCATYEAFTEKVRALLLVSKSELVNDDVKKAKKVLQEEGSSTMETFDFTIDEESYKDIDRTPMYKASPFYKVGKNLEQEFCETYLKGNVSSTADNMDQGEKCTTESKEENELFCPQFWTLFLVKYMTFAPLWSGFVIKHSITDKNEEKRFSNAAVEGWFRMVKRSILNDQTHLKVGRFVELLTDRIKSLCKEITLQIPKAACNKKKNQVNRKAKKRKQNDENDRQSILLLENDPRVEEKWVKRAKKQSTYFDSNFSEYLKTKSKTANQIKKRKTRKLKPKDNLLTTNNETLGHQPNINENENNHEKENNHDTKTTLACTTPRNDIAKTTETNQEEDYDYVQQLITTPIRYGPLNLEMQSEDFDSLEDNKYLTSGAVDGIAEFCLPRCGKKSFFYVNSDIGSHIMRGGTASSDCYIVPEDLQSNQYILIPYCIFSHWALIVADTKNKTLFHLDSLVKVSERSKKAFHLVMTFFNNLIKDNETSKRDILTGWIDHSSDIRYPSQEDHFSCGVFVLHYMTHIVQYGLKRGDIIEEIDIHECRRKYRFEIDEQANKKFIPRLENGLIELPTYYECEVRNNISLSQTKPCRTITVAYKKNKSMGRFQEKIEQEDFRSLSGNCWLTSTIVDFCNATYVKPHQFCFSTGEATLALHEGRPKYTNTFIPVATSYKNLDLIFIPYNESHHFCLYVIDVKKKLISHLDPKDTDVTHNKWKCEAVKRFFATRKKLSHKEDIDIDKFDFNPIQYPTQKDDTSCGVYVIYFLSELSKMRTVADISLEFDSTRFRQYLQQRCLQESDQMINLCLVCGEGSRRKHQWCQCHRCGRWIHYLCIGTSKSYEEMQRPSTVFKCVLCFNNNIKAVLRALRK